MSIFSKPVDAINEVDIQALIDDQLAEQKTIEYKEQLPGNSDSDKKEFLADISSFANASGGDIIYGIKEDQGMPVEVCGLPENDVDSEILRLDNIARTGIAPRIPGIASVAVQLEAGGHVIVMRVPRSWAQPHMVTFKGSSKFYSRSSAGKYPLDIGEIRAAFALTETTSERIRSFRAERLAGIIAGEMPIQKKQDSGLVVLHLVPLSSVDPLLILDLSSLPSTPGVTPTLSDWGGQRRYNFEGYLSNRQSTYLQIFRNGILEAVTGLLIGKWSDGRYTIPSGVFEKELIGKISKLLALQQQFGVEPPVLIMLTLVDVNGYVMAVKAGMYDTDEHPIDRDTLIIPEVMVEDFGASVADTMRPAFDIVWNACGWPRSLNYNDAGEWIGG